MSGVRLFQILDCTACVNVGDDLAYRLDQVAYCVSQPLATGISFDMRNPDLSVIGRDDRPGIQIRYHRPAKRKPEDFLTLFNIQFSF